MATETSDAVRVPDLQAPEDMKMSVGANTWLQMINALGNENGDDESESEEQAPVRPRSPSVASDQSSQSSSDYQPDENKTARSPRHRPKRTMSSSIYAIARRNTLPADDRSLHLSMLEAQSGDLDQHAMSPSAPVLSATPSPQSPASEQAPTPVSPSTRRAQRQSELAHKLCQIFELPESETLVAEWPCWLFRTVLLQGYLYLTEGHLCFYAYLQRKEGAVIRSGTLSKRNSATRIYHKHWFTLRDTIFSWYPSSTDPYFPLDQIDLRFAISVENSAVHPSHFKIQTAEKRYHFSADSAMNRDEWVKTLRKAMFQAQNDGDTVKISIPLESIETVEPDTSIEFAKSTLCVKVFEEDESQTNDYYFTYFHDSEQVLLQVNETLASFKVRDTKIESRLQDSTATFMPKNMVDSSDIRTLRQGSATPSAKSHLSPIIAPPSPSNDPIFAVSPTSTLPPAERTLTRTPSQGTIRLDNSKTDDTYPPHVANAARREKTWSISTMFAAPKSLLSSSSLPFKVGNFRKVTESFTPKSGSTLLKSSSDPEDADTDSDSKGLLQQLFKLSDKETVIKSTTCYLFRGIPIYGKAYISQRYFCFRSTNVLTNTKMILPIHDIVTTQKQRAYRIGYHGMVVVVKGHEELFFELSSRDKREQIRNLLDSRMDTIRSASEQEARDDPGCGESLSKLHLSDSFTQDQLPPPESASEDIPPIMFSSTSSSFVTFRPSESMHITCLTIGSRGDVQPYIALCKGLIKEGHRCRIASHGEYREWVEGHGIEFADVGGDPAELMRICVENGMFTVSFLREGMNKFRGWIDDLLRTAWKACQNTDLLIESPSAMAGLHIAEALQIPYFRGFTMPWTRTRAYPHAFAVPEHKMGGSYNFMTYTLFDQVFWKAISGQVNRWRKQVLNLQSTSVDRMEAHRVPFLYNFSPAIVPPPLDWAENIHVTGYWFLDNAEDSNSKKWEPPEGLSAFMDQAKADNKKLVYIGFGSIVVSNPEQLTRTIVEAVKLSGVRAIVSKGWSDRLSSKEAKDPAAAQKLEQTEQDLMATDQIYNIGSVPHDWLFQRVDAACHHGGAGTTGASLRAGIPTIIRPYFGDQHLWCERVESLGIGTGLRKMTVETLAKALEAATTDEKQIGRAKLVGEQIRKEDGVGNAIECIYRDLEYAKTLIKRNTQIPSADSPKSASDSTSSKQKLGRHTVPGDVSDDSSSWDLVSRGGQSSRSRTDFGSEDEDEGSPTQFARFTSPIQSRSSSRPRSRNPSPRKSEFLEEGPTYRERQIPKPTMEKVKQMFVSNELREHRDSQSDNDNDKMTTVDETSGVPQTGNSTT